ncbi:MAG: flagellar biosynthetic protein FliO, partial [Candidatus Tectomicrobia bacterium]|nr:flagellar biosynthetic protein FliO [Candidatus Tectomicrobia bacterium]
SSPPEGKVREARREPLTPESILRQSLTAGAVWPAPSAEARPAAPRAAAGPPVPFGPNEAEAAPARSKLLTPADLGAGAPSLTGLMVQMAAALGGLLALLLGGLAAFKKWGAGAADRLGAGGKVVRTLHRVYLAPKQSIALVEVAGEILVIGVSGQSISMLTKIENQAALAKLRSGGEASFVEQLARLMGGKEKSPALPAAPETAAPAPSIAALKAD